MRESYTYVFGSLTGVACLLGFQFGFDSTLIWCVVGMILFGFYMVLDVTLMMSGESVYIFEKSHHVKAATCIYLDIISIFMFCVAMLSIEN